MKKIIQLIKDQLIDGSSTKKIAQSVAMGAYIAFSPFIGFHTIMAVAFSWLFSLNFIIVFAVSIAINNPWTMIPVYALDYMFGQFVLAQISDSAYALPMDINTIANQTSSFCGINSTHLMTFIIGGNLLGCAIGAILYPLLNRLLSFSAEKNKN